MKAVLVVLVLVAFVLVAPARARGAQTSGAFVAVLPSEVNRYDNFRVSVTATPLSFFNVTVYGANGFSLHLRNLTDANGVWSASLQAWYDYGAYTFELSTVNATSFASLDVTCNAACQAEILESNNLVQQQIIYGAVQQWGLYVFLVVLFVEIARATHYFSRQAVEARRKGAYTAKESLLGLFARFRGHINPGDLVADPRNVQNPRIAVDLERRRLLEQLNEASSRRFMEWRPDHLGVLDEIFRDLKSAWSRQASIQPAGMAYAKEYARPKPAVRISDDHTRNRPEFTVRPKLAVDGMSDQEMDDFSTTLKAENGRRERSAHGTFHVGRVVVYVAGALGLLTAALVIAAYFGVYVSPLGALWSPWPPDAVKVVLGAGVFVVSLIAAAEWRAHDRGARVRA